MDELPARHWIGDNIAKNHRLLRTNHDMMPERPFASGTYSMYLLVFLYLPMYDICMCVHYRTHCVNTIGTYARFKRRALDLSYIGT